MTSPRTIETEVFVDWNNDGTFTGAYDDVSADVLADPGVTVQYGRDQARSLSPPMIPSCDFTLDNESRRYSPENAGSPLYQLIQPGRPVKVQARHGDRRTYSSHISYNSHLPYNGKGTWPLFRGNIDTMQTSVAWGRRVTAFSALGMTAQLKRKTVSVALQTDIHTNDAVNLVLNAAGWTASRVLAIGDTVLDTWWVDERPAWDVILELIGSEGAGAMVFEEPDGEFQFHSRTFRELVSPSTTPQATFYDAATGRSMPYTKHQLYAAHEPYRSGGGLTYVDLSYDPRWEDVVDRATVNTKQRALAASAVVWKLGAPLALSVGEVRTIWARPQDPFQNAISPVLTTDYTVTGGTVAIALAWANGAVAVLTATATSGAPVVADLQLRAQPFSVVGETVTESISDFAPAGLDRRTYSVPAWPELDPGQAQALAQSVTDRYGQPIPQIKLVVMNDDFAQLWGMLNLRPSWRLTLVNQQLGLNSDVWIEQITHHLSAGGLLATTFGCERVVNIAGDALTLWDSALWDTASWGL
jgi:hypothetical protein